jgi:hypothetical protein
LEPFAQLLLYGTALPNNAVYAAAVVVAAGLGWRDRKAAAPAEPREKTRFDLGDYLFITMLLVAGQAVLAMLHVAYAGSDLAQHVVASPILSRDGAEGRAIVFVLFFILSQVSIGFSARALASSLRHDWRVAEGSPRRREVLLAAGAAPCALCLGPAVHYGALLGSVLLRLAVLVFAWWSTRRAPADMDAEFLSWSPLRAGREVLRALARAVRRRCGRPPARTGGLGRTKRPLPSSPRPPRRSADSWPAYPVSGRTREGTGGTSRSAAKRYLSKYSLATAPEHSQNSPVRCLLSMAASWPAATSGEDQRI